MDQGKIRAKASDIGRRLAVLSDKLRATNSKDLQMMSDLYAETARFQQIHDELMRSLASKPPGTTGHPVR